MIFQAIQPIYLKKKKAPNKVYYMNMWKCHIETHYFKQCSLIKMYFKNHEPGDWGSGSVGLSTAAQA